MASISTVNLGRALTITMTLVKYLDAPLIVSGWIKIDHESPMEQGDVCVYGKPSKIGGPVDFPLPSEVNSDSQFGNKGFVIQGWAGKPVSHIGEYYMPAELEGFYYAVFRKSKVRTYHPSKWAEPLPLP